MEPVRKPAINGPWGLSPLIHLSNNWISLLGVAVVTTSGIIWLLLMLTGFFSAGHENPYIGIMAFLVLPGFFLGGLALIPLGLFLKRRRENAQGIYPSDFPPVNFQNADFRRLVGFVAIATVANLVISGHLTYRGVHFMESTEFCGQTCHTVMQPEFTARQNSPHLRVNCVDCHIGPGASWFVKSKLSGVRQVFAVAFKTYSTPIPTPVHDLRPARDTCEQCHWPQKFTPNWLRVITHYDQDEKNTPKKTVLMMHIGGGHTRRGIHGAHLGEGIRTRYYASDDKRQSIPWVEHTDAKTGRKTIYMAPGFEESKIDPNAIREMDCIDCHNRPTHTFELAAVAMDRAITEGGASPELPYLKREGLALLQQEFSTREEAAREIPLRLAAFYRQNYPSLASQKADLVEQAGKAIVVAYQRNIFPDMKVTWGTYPNNIGHNDFPGCFRCHDSEHASKDERVLEQDCSACHDLLAMEEEKPKILQDLGIEPAPAQPSHDKKALLDYRGYPNHRDAKIALALELAARASLPRSRSRSTLE